MKTIPLTLATLTLCSCCLVGCGRNAEPDSTTAATTATTTTAKPFADFTVDPPAEDFGDMPVGGGWTAMSAIPGTLPSNAYHAFERAVKDWEGEKPVALACIGEQVVAGTNYAILCKLGDQLTILYIYDPIGEGTAPQNATVINRVDITVADFIQTPAAENADELPAGGWYTPEYGNVTLTDMAKDAYEKAMDGLDGVGYEPLACVGSQVVAGVNYAYVCRGTGVYPGAQPNTYIITVYADLSGNATVNSITLIHAEDLIPNA